MESMGYSTSVIIEQMVATDVALALDSVASSAMSKSDVLDTLLMANKQLEEVLAHVTKENEKLLTMISQLTTNTMKPKPCKQALQIVIAGHTALL